jgi:Na+/H+-dicarboxylate symporter/ABC-type amino acid transport substrate-binding protein
MTFSRKILVGLIAGVAVGVSLGELAAPFGIIAEGFVRLLQMTVLPYVTVSIVLSLGSLDLAGAKRLGLGVGVIIAGLWAVGLMFALLFPLAFPPAENASFFSASIVEQPPPFDFVNLFIPSNPFHSLANSIVPAVVLFSVVVGVALIGVQKKAVLLDVLGVASAAIARATRIVVRLTPYGIFALAATAAGTLRLDQVQRIEVYLITYMAISLLVAVWVLPGLVAAFTPIPHREILRRTQAALITAFTAGDLFIVLPSLMDSCTELLARHHVTDIRTARLPEVIVPASFNFPHTGKVLSLSFILFAGWFADAAVPLMAYPRLALTGILAFFGSLNAAVPFLLDAFRIPSDTFQLFVATGVINSHFGALTAAVHTVAVALLGSAAIAGTVQFDWRRGVRFGVTTALLTAVVIGGLRLTFRTWLAPEFSGSAVVFGMTDAFDHPPTRVVESTTADAPPVKALERIQARRTLRVGFVQPRLPFAFRNARQDLVGLDVDLVHVLARDLEVDVEFVEYPATELVGAVSSGRADIGIGGYALTPALATGAAFSAPYLDETAAFVVKDHLRRRFETWASIQDAKDLVIGVPALPYYERLLKARLPGVPLRTYAPAQDPLDPKSGFDAVALPAERGSVLTLLNPKWSVVVPSPGLIKVPLAFPLPSGDAAWASFVNSWIEMKRRDGTLDVLYEHWILGKAAETRAPRWSVVRNVLHWVD